MAKGINYGRLMHKALRHLIADVLAQVARDGLPGKHHFYITFETRHAGVDMSPSLQERYPEEMTIVMQDWFSGLAVMTDRFSVTLNFGNVPEPIVIPFEAIKTFVDPSVEFGLRFDAHEEGAGEATDEGEAEGQRATPEDGRDAPGGRGEGEVVSLDKFRKH
ncbi:ClpXP protease specificity-enhancing factor SspB [soil metagenome]